MNPFPQLSGAIEDPANGTAAHYGSPLIEQRELEAGRAVVDLSHEGVITVAGPDRLRWIHSMTSQGVASLRPGASTETLLLDPNGRIEHAIRLVDDGERSWLLVDRGQAESLTAFLLRMRFALRVEVADVSDEYATLLAFDGPAGDALAGAAPVAIWRDPWSTVLAGGVQYATAAEHPGADWTAARFVFPVSRLREVVDGVGLGDALWPAGTLALDALEIRAWRPSQAGDLDERSIPHEFDWLRTAVHLTKGCYRGQETVAKVHNLGHPPRRLAMLHLDGSGGELPHGGALVYVADGSGAAAEQRRPVGRITRAALHHEWGGIALALLKRSVPADATLEVRLGDPEETGEAAGHAAEFVAASQEAIVPPDAGATRDIPRLQRFPRV